MIWNILTYVKLEKPQMLYLAIPLIIVLIALLMWNFVKFNYEEKKKAVKHRMVVLILRSIAIILLVIALAAPYTIKQEASEGNPTITLLIDNSTSMDLFGFNAVKFKDSLEKLVPVNMYYIGSGEESRIGDNIFKHIHNKNILVVTDGNNDPDSMALMDVAALASKINSSINFISLEQKSMDSGVYITGPRSSIVETEYHYSVKLTNLKDPVRLQVIVDDKVAFDEEVDKEETQFTNKFTTIGQHRIAAKLAARDHFEQNNEYYKAVDVVEKPKVLYVSDKESFIDDILLSRYDVTKSSSIISPLSKYFAVIVNDRIMSITEGQGVELEAYTDDGNGLVIIGGKNSFNDKSNIDLILPVEPGKPEETGFDFNFVILTDASGYVTQALTREEEIAIYLIKQLEKRNELINAALINFAHKPQVQHEWANVKAESDALQKSLISFKEISTINNVPWIRPARLDFGIKKSMEFLEGRKGNNNIIVISDGAISADTFGKAAELIQQLRAKGGRVHSFNFRNDEFDDTVLEVNRKNIAKYGRGAYINSVEDINKLFEKSLIISDPTHWITEGLSLNSYVSNFNNVIPTAAAQVLVTTGTGAPILSTNSYNKVAVVSTDDGAEWAGSMFKGENIFLYYRLFDWAIGDPNRNKEEYLRVENAIVNKRALVEYKSRTQPNTDTCKFYAKEDHYECTYIPKNVGFDSMLGSIFEVNYDEEYKEIGFKEDFLKEVALKSAGLMFPADKENAIAEKAKAKARVEIFKKKYIDWYFIVVALILFIIEVAIRRISEQLRRAGEG